MTDTHTEDEQVASSYEITYLVRKEEDASFLSGVLQKYGSLIEHEEPLRKMQLAYPIRKEVFAFLGLIRFHADPSRLPELNASLRLEDRILRYLITHPTSFELRSRAGDSSREDYPSGRRTPEAHRPPLSSSSSHPLSNEALQEKIEEILQ